MQNGVAKLPGVFVVFGELQIVFCAGGLVTCCDAPVDPIIAFEHLATSEDLLGAQDFRNLQKHSFLEPETRAQHRHSSWSRHDVTATNAIEIVLVRQVGDIEPEIHVAGNGV